VNEPPRAIDSNLTATSTVGGGSANAAFDPLASHLNHRRLPNFHFNFADWQLVASVEPTTTQVIDASRIIAVHFRSDAFPPMHQWFAEIWATPLNEDGSMQDVVGPPSWFEAIRYTVMTGNTRSSDPGFVNPLFVLDAGLPGEQSDSKYRWYLTIPAQKATIKHYTWIAIDVYVRRGTIRQ